MFQVHNDTANIWTHFLGSIFFFALAFLTTNESFAFWEKILLTVYLLSAAFCFLGSALFHILLCHSEPVFLMMSKLDYVGISFLVSGSMMPIVHFGFYEDHWLEVKFFYLSLVLAATLACVYYVCFTPGFEKPQYRSLRARLFANVSLVGVFPLAHMIFSFGFFHARVGLILYTLLFTISFYILGAVVYAMRLPEKFFPQSGHFDIWLSSHQSMHTLVFIGALMHYLGVYNLYTYQLPSMIASM